MSIESSSAPQGAKAVAGHDHRASKRPAQAQAAAGDAPSGFSALMGLLSAAEAQPDAAVVADPLSVPENSVLSVVDPAAVTAFAVNAQPALILTPTATLPTEVDNVIDSNAPVALENKGNVATTVVAKMATTPAGLVQPGADNVLIEKVTETLINATQVAINSEAIVSVLTGQSSAASLVPENAPSIPVMGAQVVINPTPTSVVDLTATVDLNSHLAVNSAAPAPVLTGQPDAVSFISASAPSIPVVGSQVAVNATATATATPVALAVQPSMADVVREVRYQASQASVGVVADRLGRTSKDGLPLVLDQAAASSGSDLSVQSQVDALLSHRNASQPLVLSAVQAQLREVKAQPIEANWAKAPDASATLALTGATDVLVRMQERPGNKASGLQAGSGFEGVFSSASVGTSGLDSTYEIAATSATVPDSGIAETVSYWVTHGVQSAELTLDGLGSEPVEVRISLNGDQAQIDFRTNQMDVRQVLEGASAHLKELLAGEGLQLTGLSVGTSGGGSAQSGAQQQRPGARQATVTPPPVAVAAASRSANLTVGRTLDLFA